jgi:hypothetical protein
MTGCVWSVCRSTCDTYSTQHNKEADWTTRQLYTVKTPAAMARASEHFGATVPYVELENSGGPGIQGVLLEVSPIGRRPRAESNMHPDGRDASPTSRCTLLYLFVLY